MCFEIIIGREHLGGDELLLKDGDEVEKVLRRVVTDIINLIRRDRKLILTILLLWCVLHNAYYPINVGKITLTVTVVKDLNSFTFTKFVGEPEIRHVRTTCRTINSKKTKAC